MRGTLAPAVMPITRSRSQLFDEIVIDSIDRVQQAIPELEDVEISVEEVPPGRRDDGAPDPVPLGRVEPARTGMPARLIVHRRPIELRAPSGPDREDLVHDVVAELVAELFGISPEQVDPDYNQGREA